MKGRKRHIVTDTQGLVLAVKVHPANRHDSKAAMEGLKQLKPEFKRMKKIYADGGYRDELNSSTTTVRFTSYGAYTLSANFTLPGGANYAATKTINLAPPAPPTPSLYVDSASGEMSNGRWVWRPSYGNIRITASSYPYQPGVTYEWFSNMTGPYRGLSSLTGETVTVTLPQTDPEGMGIYQMLVTCQARLNGVLSGWSEQVNILVDYNPYYYNAPMNDKDKKQEQQQIDDVKEPESI